MDYWRLDYFPSFYFGNSLLLDRRDVPNPPRQRLSPTVRTRRGGTMQRWRIKKARNQKGRR